MKQGKVSPILVIASAIILVAGIGAIKLGSPEPKSYSFVSVDHPVDMWEDGKDKWAYYFIGTGTTKDLATKAGIDLKAQGFVEDNTKKPWYRFVKGDREVIVCNHSEFGVNVQRDGSSKVVNSSSMKVPLPTTAMPCILVKNGPGTNTSVSFFKIKKLVRLW